MRIGKHVGFLAVAIGLSLLLVPAALPATVVSYGRGIERLEVFDAGCGPAVSAALQHPERDCGRLARQRLLVTGTAGTLLVALGAVVLTGAADRRRSRLSSRR